MSLRVDQLVDIVRHHVDIGAQRGAQIYVSLDGRTLLDVGVGTTAAGVPITPQHVLPWMGATRVLVTLAVGQLIEKDALSLDDTVGAHLPAAATRADCTIRQLLTHLGGFPTADTSELVGTDEQMTREALTHPSLYQPGRRAHFHRSGAWRVLGEVVAAVADQDLTGYIREHIWEPLGMDATYLALDHDDLARLGDWLVLPEQGDPRGRGWNGRLAPPTVRVERRREHSVLARVDPDTGGYGPAHDLARPFEALLVGRPVPIRDQLMVELISGTHRVGLRDGGFGGERVPWGLGMMVAGGFNGTVGHRAFGHDGLPGGRVLCDPDERLVMVYLTSGIVGPDDDARRVSEVTTAVYEMAAPAPQAATVTAEVTERSD